MKRRASTVHRRGPGRRRAASAPALVSRDAFCVLSGVSERELAMWGRRRWLLRPAWSCLTAPRAALRTETLRRARLIRTLAEDPANLPGIDIISTCSTRCIAERVCCVARHGARHGVCEFIQKAQEGKPRVLLLSSSACFLPERSESASAVEGTCAVLRACSQTHSTNLLV
jgi:hypothetical protein